ncbi:MAG: sigma factor [Cytophagales bacterium]|nr:sigma factor [Cytophagales bacterium]
MSDLSERQFIAAIDQSKKSIYRICSVYASPPLEAQDLFQEVVFQIWKSYSSFQHRSNISTWIYKIALNVCYSSKKNYDRKHVRTSRLDSIHFMADDYDSDDETTTRFKALSGMYR